MTLTELMGPLNSKPTNLFYMSDYRMSSFRMEDLEDSDPEMNDSQVDMSLERAKLMPATRSIIVR